MSEVESRLDRAIALAVDAHRGQMDKGGEPYILHPLRVMLVCKTEDERIAAVLHDVVEDGGIEISLIRHRFGKIIAGAVDALSRRRSETYEDFIERCGQNEIARSVKMEDLADNMDLSRLLRTSDRDLARNEKYRRAWDRLAILDAATS